MTTAARARDDTDRSHRDDAGSAGRASVRPAPQRPNPAAAGWVGERGQPGEGHPGVSVPSEPGNGQRAGARPAAPAKRRSTPWPGGRRRNWRAALMLAGAAFVMSALLTLWGWLTA
ncbi:hypothetical protein [Ancylobacter mangrovi]|uniref:hypothetical protein n=1 Tax=Ancylobacter mangrovi TaxID=2972472 RepID=UPI0021617D0A|nr:hypothetical protein [Ancylobacter mangrovi]MCS0501164.1 hypothetical protein [Ancylobacter mangrovi]